jgi:hypothetical protein
MSTQHTPGPWKVDEPHQVLAESVGEYVAITQAEEWNALPRDQVEANARLIAAAPDLLEALQEVVKLANQAHDHWDNDRDAKVGKILLALSGHMPRYDKRIDAIHAAIAKATGEHHGN